MSAPPSRGNSRSRPSSPIRNTERTTFSSPSSPTNIDFQSSELNANTVLTLGAKLNDLAISLGKNHLVDLSKVRRDLNNQALTLDSKFDLQNEKISSLSKDVQNEILTQELNFAQVDNSVHPPVNFASEATLTDPRRLHDVAKIFPTRDKFNGNSNILSFLSQLNYCQEVAQLTHSEFRDMMLRCFSKTPYTYVEEFLKNNMSTQDIYYSLISLYDSRLSPDEAKSNLNNLKVSKNTKLAKVIGEIMLLGGRASSILPEGEARCALYNVECNSAFVKVLPPHSSTLVSNQINLLHAKLQRSPTFVEVCKSVKPFFDSIQKNIDSLGTNDPSNFHKRFKPKVYSLSKESDEQSKQTFKKPSNFQNKNSGFNRSRPSTKFTPQSKTGSHDMSMDKKKYCTLCGRNGHTAKDLCYKMRLDNNKIISVVPSYTPCPTCLEKNNVRLFHPVKYCFNRDNYPKQSRGSLSKPVGHS